MTEIVVQHILCKHEHLLLSNQRALYWEKERVLVLADMHLGKTAHFRQHGIAIPSSVMHHDLDRLSALVLHFNPLKLIVVGDMFHAGFNRDLDAFYAWRLQFPALDIQLVKGNHDRLSAREYSDLGINSCCTELDMHPFYFIHHPKQLSTEYFTISGHLHPGRMIYGLGRQMIKLPCYIVAEQQLILPAFSLFTGLDTKAPEGDNTYFLLTENGVFEM
jgi:DNA ligase-associated metallophosphoesterase